MNGPFATAQWGHRQLGPVSTVLMQASALLLRPVLMNAAGWCSWVGETGRYLSGCLICTL